MCVLLGFLQKTWAFPIMNPLSWFMILKGKLLNVAMASKPLVTVMYGFLIGSTEAVQAVIE